MFSTMTTITPQFFSQFTDCKTPKLQQPMMRRCVCCYHHQGFRLGFEFSGKLLRYKDWFGEKIKTKKKKKRVVFVRFNNDKFNGGDGGNDEAGGTSTVLRNLGLGVGLIYFSLTGQLGWIIDAVVSFLLVVVLMVVVGFGALIWWASRDMVEIKCCNCGNEFEVFESMLTYEPQLCPYCSQPFSVVGDDFVRDHMKFSKEPTTFDEALNNLFSQSKNGKASSRTVIDVEAEVKDVE